MIYYMCCTIENNNCPKKEECKRYLNAEDNSCMTLFKYACTEENNYHLFMKQENNDTTINENSIEEKKENEEEQTND